MSFIELLLLALALSADTLAVSVSCALANPNLRVSSILGIALVLSIFQGFMPLLGWLGGAFIRPIIEPVAAWIAFGLLLVVGGKMLLDALRSSERQSIDLLRPRTLLLIALATSIDALSVGVGLALIEVNLVAIVFVIGLTTFAVACFGLLCGGLLSRLKWFSPGILAGIILIGIGIKTLYVYLVS